MMRTATALRSAWVEFLAGAQTWPNGEGEDRGKNDCRNKVTCDSIRELLDRSAAALRLANHADDLREQRFIADALGAHDEGAGAVYCAASDAASFRFLDGDWLSGH